MSPSLALFFCVLVASPLATGCKRGGSSPDLPAEAAPRPSSGSPVASQASSAPPAEGPRVIDEMLAPHAVYHGSFSRRVLYAWTTSAQIDELRQRGALLLRAPTTARGLAGFDTERAGRADRVSALLDAPPLDRRRLAWSNPWATALGVLGEAPGGALVKVVLRPDAIVARFDPAAAERWAYATAQGEPVAEGLVLSHPERLGAVYHVARRAIPDAGSVLPYREYVLCNESMIESYAVGTRDVLDDIARYQALLGALRAALPVGDPSPGEPFGADVERTVWPEATASASTAQLYEASLAVLSEPYRPAAANLDAMAAALERARSDASSPLEHAARDRAPAAVPSASAASKITSPFVQTGPREYCAGVGPQRRCLPGPPSRRLPRDGRFCADPVTGGMMDCPR